MHEIINTCMLYPVSPSGIIPLISVGVDFSLPHPACCIIYTPPLPSSPHYVSLSLSTNLTHAPVFFCFFFLSFYISAAPGDFVCVHASPRMKCTAASVLLVATATALVSLVECTSSDDESTVNRIRADESHLRALVVILSLTGGLAIAFGLGAGICLYWHCRAFRRRKLRKSQLQQHRDEEISVLPMQENQQPAPVDLPAIIVTSPSENITPLTAIENSHTTASSSPSTVPMTTATTTTAQPPSQPVIPTPPDTSTVLEEPGPSAPSAKELLIGQDNNNGNNAHTDDSAIVFHSECCCQHPIVQPPPAYSPYSYPQPLVLDPDTAPAIAYVNRYM